MIGYAFAAGKQYGVVTLVTFFLNLSATWYSHSKAGHGRLAWNLAATVDVYRIDPEFTKCARAARMISQNRTAATAHSRSAPLGNSGGAA